MKKFILLALFATILPTMADDSTGSAIDLTPQQFRKLPVSTPMYTAEQIDHLITDKLVILGDYNVVIGLDAYGDTVILDTSVDPFDGKGLHVGEPQISNVAVGWWATNLAYRGTAVGKLAKTGDEYSTAIGYKATAIPERSTSVDATIYGEGADDVAIRSSIMKGADKCVAIGTQVEHANGIKPGCQNSVAIGPGARVNSGVDGGIAIGYNATVTKNHQIVIGCNNPDVTVGSVNLADLLSKLEACERKLEKVDAAMTDLSSLDNLLQAFAN